MRHDHLFFCWLVRCGSEEQARSIRQNLDASPLISMIFPETVRAFPNGSEVQQTQAHVVSDYFASVSIFPGSSPSAFQLLFQRKPDAPRHWKDVMMYLLRRVRDGDIRKESIPVQIVLTYRGDTYPPPELGL